MANKTLKDQPPTAMLESDQYDLFTTFYKTAGVTDLSNNIHLWDSIPKYYVSAKEQSKLRTVEGFLENLRRDFEVRGVSPDEVANCSVEIQAARIEINGEMKSLYPGETEELVEKVLRKIFEDSNYGIYEEEKKNSWVKFSVNMIREELKKQQKSRSHKEVKQALDVLASCTITFFLDGEEIYKDSIISSLIKVDRSKYQEDGLSQWACKLPMMISSAIESGRYSQYDYGLDMSLNTPLARWLHKQLSSRFINADQSNHYDFWFNSIKQNTGFLDSGNPQNQRRKIEKALEELIQANVILHKADVKQFKNGRVITNIRYRVKATEHFIKTMKANNARINETEKKLSSTVGHHQMEHS